jgi:hypothetical protein
VRAVAGDAGRGWIGHVQEAVVVARIDLWEIARARRELAVTEETALQRVLLGHDRGGVG